MFSIQQNALLSSFGMSNRPTTSTPPEEPAAPESSHPVSERVLARRRQIQRAAERAAELAEDREAMMSNTDVIDMEVDSPTEVVELVEAEYIPENAGNQHGQQVFNLDQYFLTSTEVFVDEE